MKVNYDIIIAGAGPVGLACALALSQASDQSLKIAVCDPSLGSRKSFGRISALAPASSNLLEVLGAWERLHPLASPILEMQISDSRTRDSIRLPILSFESDPSAGPIAHILPNAEIEHLLHGMAQNNGIALITAEVQSMQAQASFAEIRFVTHEPLYTRLVVAADGRQSRLRRMFGLTTIGWDYAVSGIVATIGHERDHEGIARQHFLPAGPFAALPMTQSRSSIVWCEPHSRAQELIQGSRDVFMHELETRFGFELGDLSLLDQPVAYPLSLQLARTMCAPRLVLLGDAAHVIHPIAGQGLNLAFRGVAVLAEEIIAQIRLGLDPGAPQPLENYERRRRFDTLTTGLGMDALYRLFANDLTSLRLIRDLGLGLVDRSHAIKKSLMREAAGKTGQVPLLLQGLPI